MKLDVIVTDQQGKSVGGLGEKDFTLLDNGQPRNIVSFQAFDNAASRPDPPVEIILVIDEIDTSPAYLDNIQQAAQKFLLQNGPRLAQPVVVYQVNSEGLFASGPSNDGRALVNQISERKGPRTIWRAADIAGAFKRDIYGSTPRYKAIPFNEQWAELPHSIVALGSIAIEERRTQGRKLMFWLGRPWPAKPRPSRYLFDTVTELSTRLREARIAIWFGSFWQQPEEDPLWYQKFLRGVTSEKVPSFENIALQVLAVQSGGGQLQGEGDAADLISRQVDQANSFYTLTFDPYRTDAVDEYHDLKIAVSKPGITASTNTGYYDEPSYYDQARSDATNVTVAQLRESIEELQHVSDSEAERRLASVELTERLSSSELAKWLAMLKGKKAQQALITVADQSAFFAPPAEDTVSLPPPSIADQHKMIQRTVDYVSKTISILPNLSAERSTTLYAGPPHAVGQTWKTTVGDHSLAPASFAKAAVHVVQGKESTEELTSTVIRKIPQSRSLQTEGAFGPILAGVLVAVARPENKLMWARWEKGTSGPLSVFRYYISKDTPIFKVGYCCMAVDFRQVDFEANPPTSGEIAVDPATGAILRFIMRAGLAWRLPLQRADIMIEYGPVVLGEMTYICPVRSVSISRPRSVVQLSEFGESFKVYAPFETVLNDVKFENYHLFRSSSRVLPGFSDSPVDK